MVKDTLRSGNRLAFWFTSQRVFCSTAANRCGIQREASTEDPLHGENSADLADPTHQTETQRRGPVSENDQTATRCPPCLGKHGWLTCTSSTASGGKGRIPVC